MSKKKVLMITLLLDIIPKNLKIKFSTDDIVSFLVGKKLLNSQEQLKTIESLELDSSLLHFISQNLAENFGKV